MYSKKIKGFSIYIKSSLFFLPIKFKLVISTYSSSETLLYKINLTSFTSGLATYWNLDIHYSEII